MAGMGETKGAGIMDIVNQSKGGGLKGVMDTLVSKQIDSGTAPMTRDRMDKLKSTGKQGMVQGFGGLSNLSDLIGGRLK